MKTKKDHTLFCSYASADKQLAFEFLSELETFLKTAHTKSSIWIDRKGIVIGEDFHAKIQAALKSSDFGIALLSNHFFASDYIGDHELPHLISEGKLLPIQLRLTTANTDHKGIRDSQVFALEESGKRLPYSQCSPQQQERFIAEAFDQIYTRLRQTPSTI